MTDEYRREMNDVEHALYIINRMDNHESPTVRREAKDAIAALENLYAALSKLKMEARKLK